MENLRYLYRRGLQWGRILAVLLLTSTGLLLLIGTTSRGSRAQAQQQNVAGCRQVLLNSDFEGTGGWVQHSKLGVPLISKFPPASGSYHSGTHGAYLGGYNNAQDSIGQTFTIPADATQATLTYWWQVESQESTLSSYDVLTVTVDAPLGHPFATLGTLSNRDAKASWQQTSVDLLAYRGQALAVRFEARTDANRPTSFFLDDVTLRVCVPTPTPIPTSTPSPTPTPTLTPTSTPSPTPVPHYYRYFPFLHVHRP